ncbi:MAG: LamG domain-containing protein, partial [Patescibacteria group bacterium]
QARDSKRQQDLSALNQALNTITTLDQSLFMGTSSLVYTSLPDATTTCANWNLPSLPAGWQYYCVATSSLQNTNGTGWIPVNFKTTGVVSLSSLPTDPINASSSNLFYTYVSGGSFELNGILESTKYRSNPSLSKPNLPGVLSYGSNQALSPLYNTSGLVGYWNFDEGTGTVALDSSGNNNTGTIYGPPAWINGKVGKALVFNGTTNYVSAGNGSAVNITSSLTLATWAMLTSQSIVGTFISKGNYNAGRAGYVFYPMYSPPKFGVGVELQGVSPANLLTPSYTLDFNQWYFVAITRDGSKTSIYVDGSLVAQQSATGAIITNTDNLTIGNDSGLAYPHKGYLDDVRVYNRALSPGEIRSLYNATK